MRTSAAVLFDSGRMDWETPPAWFKLLDNEFHFDLDVAASSVNTKCQAYFDEATDGLQQDWAPHTCWMNPPYGRTIGKWVEKAYQESLKGATVVCFVPARTDTKWWHEFVARASEVRFVKGRVKFVGSPNSATFPSVIVVFTPYQPQFTPPRFGFTERCK